MHAKIFFQWLAFIAAIFLTVSYLGNLTAQQVVMHSGFRLAMAANGGNYFTKRKLHVAIGNSQLMDGLNANQINQQRRDIRFLNLAFNGLESPDLVAVLATFYKTCSCTVDRLYVNAGALTDETPGTSEVEVFMSAFNRELLTDILQDQPHMRFALSILPLLHFNNEVFHRSIYYWLQRNDDQGHGNAYRFRIPAITQNQAREVRKSAVIDKPRTERIVNIARANHTELIVVVPPFHPLYLEKRADTFQAYLTQLRAELAKFDVPVLDHSAHIVTRHEDFADLIHLHLDGQKTYSQYFSEQVIPRLNPPTR